MSIFSTIALTANIIANQFCVDLNVEKCDIDIIFLSADKLPWVYDPKGTRRAHGWCENNVMTLNSDCWQVINKWEKKELVYHELGHCWLNLGHNNDISIMNPFPKATNYHVKEDGSNWKSLLKDLKKRTKGGGI
jgi:hypothetical protein